MSAASSSGPFVVEPSRRHRPARALRPAARSARPSDRESRERDTGPSPTARRASRGQAGIRASGQKRVHGAPETRLEQENRQRRRGREQERHSEAHGRPDAQPVRVRQPQGGEKESGELHPPGERNRRATTCRRRAQPESPHEHGRHDPVVRVCVQHVGRERVREPARTRAAPPAVSRRSACRPGPVRARPAGRRRSRSRVQPEASPTCPTSARASTAGT